MPIWKIAKKFYGLTQLSNFFSRVKNDETEGKT